MTTTKDPPAHASGAFTLDAPPAPNTSCFFCEEARRRLEECHRRRASLATKTGNPQRLRRIDQHVAALELSLLRHRFDAPR